MGAGAKSCYLVFPADGFFAVDLPRDELPEVLDLRPVLAAAVLVVRLPAADFFEPDGIAVPLLDFALFELRPGTSLGLPGFALRLRLRAVLALVPVALVPDALPAADSLVPFDTGRRTASPTAVTNAFPRTAPPPGAAPTRATLSSWTSSRPVSSASANTVTSSIAANVDASRLSTDEFNPTMSGPSIPPIAPTRIVRQIAPFVADRLMRLPIQPVIPPRTAPITSQNTIALGGTRSQLARMAPVDEKTTRAPRARRICHAHASELLNMCHLKAVSRSTAYGLMRCSIGRPASRQASFRACSADPTGLSVTSTTVEEKLVIP